MESAITVKVKTGHEKLGNHVADFFRKLGHDVEVVGTDAIELPIEIVLSNALDEH